jgi:hypothetical protein
MAERILPAEPQAPAPTTHPYNDPDLSPIEFLQCVMHATHQPMAVRIAAASALLPYTHPVPRKAQGSVPYRCKIIIGGLGACDPSPGPTENHSQNRVSLNKTLTRDEDTQAPQNMTRDPEPSYLPDYSVPPSPQELAEIHAAISKLRPDLAHLPIPEPRFCRCGHWVSSPCPLGDACRERSKLN